MRLLLEISSVALLVVWGYLSPLPFRDHVRLWIPWAQIAPSRLANLRAGINTAANAQAGVEAAPRRGDWMWESSSPLEQGAYHKAMPNK